MDSAGGTSIRLGAVCGLIRLDMVQPGERLDQLDLVRGTDRAGFDLEPFARAFLVGPHVLANRSWSCSSVRTGYGPAPHYVSSTIGKTATRCRRRDRPFPMRRRRSRAA